MNTKNLINEYLIEQQKESAKRERSGKYNPSKFGRCYRLQLFNRLNIPYSNPMDEVGLRKVSQGTATHILNQTALKEKGLKCEVRIETEHILGFADIEKEDMIIDIKSSEDFQIKRYWNKPTEVLLSTKKPDWLQVGWYSLEKKKPYATICPCAFGTYIDREVTILTEDIRKEVETEVNTLIWHYGNYDTLKTIPPAIPRAFNRQDCQYCSWLNHCKGVEHSANRPHPSDQPEPNSKGE